MPRTPLIAAYQYTPSTQQEEGIEAATQVYLRGDLLVSTGGRLSLAGANPTLIVGVANGPAVGTIGTRSRYVPVRPEQVFEISIDRASTLGTAVLTQAMLYEDFGVTRDANGIWYLDLDKDVANQRVRIVRFKDDVGDNQPRVFVIFIPTQTIYGS